MKRVLSLVVIAIIGIVFLYLSRFWPFALWDGAGLFGVKELTPGGGLVAQFLRGTQLAPFELLIWVIGVFLILTLLQKLFDKLNGH